MTTQYVAVAGTWGQRLNGGRAIDPWVDWWHPSSHWSAALRMLGWEPFRPDPFIWSTDLDGTWLQRLVQRRRWGDWMAAAYALGYYIGQAPRRDVDPTAHAVACESTPLYRGSGTEPPVVIAHSHGGNVALLAYGRLGIEVGGLITVSTPVRADVLEACRAAYGLPAPWVHVYGDWRDRWQWLGEIGDGALGIRRAMPPPAQNLPIGGEHGHSGLLTSVSGLRAWPQILGLIRSVGRS